MRALGLLLRLISFAPGLSYFCNKIRRKFDGSCLNQYKLTFTHGSIMNIYIAYELNLWDRGYNDYPTLENSLFGAIKLVRNAYVDKYKYSEYGVGFERRRTFSVANRFDRNMKNFGVDMSSHVHVYNKTKDILILGEGPTQGLDDKKNIFV